MRIQTGTERAQTTDKVKWEMYGERNTDKKKERKIRTNTYKGRQKRNKKYRQR